MRAVYTPDERVFGSVNVPAEPRAEPVLAAIRSCVMAERFNRPVPISFGKPGTARNIMSVTDAAQVLMDPRWPKRGPGHIAACAALIEWSERPSISRVERVRVAFCEAAEEAGILIATAIH